jgi:nucleotide-binding universal stress UspA family protein
VKILVATDGSRYTKRMLAYLAAHDEWLGARHAYTVITVVAPLPARAAAVLPKDVLSAHYAEEAEKVLKPVRTFLARQGLVVDYLTKTGAAAETIATTASKGKYDMLVMGSHGHGSFGTLVLGSVASKVLAQCSTPVLLIR